LPDIGIDKDHLNNEIELFANDSLNSFKSTDFTIMDFEINSKSIIRMREDYGLRIFYNKSSKWVEIFPFVQNIGLTMVTLPTLETTSNKSNKNRIQTFNNLRFYMIYPEDPKAIKNRPIFIPPLVKFIGPSVTDILVFIQGERFDKTNNEFVKIGTYRRIRLSN
jgi:hypothetical protein